MRVLLVEPYFVGSHRSWAEGYAGRSVHDVRLLTHPGRWWKWRMRGSAVTLAESLRRLGDWRADLVLVSDMVDLAHFRLFARAWLGAAPVVIYFHESQLTYPTAGGEPDLSYALTNWISARAADLVLFNSDYHRDAFFGALPHLLRDFPDLTHEHLIGQVEERSEVLPVGVDLSWVKPNQRPPTGRPRIVWNHRWDHDKDPGAFAQAVADLVQCGADFELVLLGARPPQPPDALTRIRESAGERLIHDGEASPALYRELLSTCDILVSTARQEFFGVAVVEAVASGCRPVLPNRLSYPWLIPQVFHESVLHPEGELLPALIRALEEPSAPPGLASAMHRFSWEEMAPRYDRRFEMMLE